MHQALYRKWRPATFDDVMGQDHITSVLRYECEHGKFSHAYLFCGSRGTGKTTCAKILAKAVNCTSPVNGSPCGKCPSCIAIEQGSTADVLEMDAASNNRVDDIREIRDEVIYSPTMLKYRVYIVDEVHMLTTSAFNALLKTLEEPPAHVVFILATTELHKLPSTIISRCQRFDFRRISIPVITERLMKIAKSEGIEIDLGAAQLIARLAMGGMRDAVSLLELCAGARQHITETLVADSLGISGRDSTASLAEAIYKKDYEKIFATVSEVVSSSKDIAVFVQDLLSFYRDMLVIKTSQDARKYLDFTESEMEQTEKVASLFSKETLIYHCKLLDQVYAQIQRSVSSSRLLAEMTFIRMCDESLDASSEALASRVSAIEDRLDAGLYTVQSTPAPVHTTLNTEKKADETVEAAKASEENKTPVPTPSASGKKRALTYWIEAVDKICRNDPSLTGFLKSSRIYRAENGNIVIRLESDFSKLMLTSRKSTIEALVKVLSAYEKRPMTEANIEFEVSHENDIIDEGRENLDEIMNNFNTNSED